MGARPACLHSSPFSPSQRVPYTQCSHGVLRMYVPIVTIAQQSGRESNATCITTITCGHSYRPAQVSLTVSNGYTAPHDGQITMTFSGQIPLGYRRGEASSTEPVLVTRSGVCMAGCATFTGDARGAEQAAAPFTFELYEVVTPALRNGGSGQIRPTQKGHTVKMFMIVFLGFALQGCLALQGDVPCAVETQRRLGSRLRNHR